MSNAIISFDKGRDGDEGFDFNDDGTLHASAASYEIDGVGSIGLNVEETKKLYEAMKVFYGD